MRSKMPDRFAIRRCLFLWVILQLMVLAEAAEPEPVKPIGGALFIHGGGELPPPLMDEFLSFSG